MMKIRVTPHEKMVMELCVRSVLCRLLNQDEEAIEDFTSILHNLNIGAFGDQGFLIEDTDNWVGQLETLRSCLHKLETPEWRKLCVHTDSEEYRLPQEE
jgi:hypothetical protein